MLADIRFELEHVLEGEDMRDNLPLSRVNGPFTSAEEPPVDGYERVVKTALQAPVTVCVNDLEGVWVCDRHVVWSNSDKGSCKTSGRRCQFRGAGRTEVVWRRGRFTILLV